MTVSATHDARHAATAASAALPPSARISAPASAVAGGRPRRRPESRDALGEPAAESSEAFEREVEALADVSALGDLEGPLADRPGGELPVVELHRQPADREGDLIPGVAV